MDFVTRLIPESGADNALTFLIAAFPLFHGTLQHYIKDR